MLNLIQSWDFQINTWENIPYLYVLSSRNYTDFYTITDTNIFEAYV